MTAFAASTENGCAHSDEDACFSLAAGVQVRAEKSGLLFYNRKGPRLYFLSSGKSLHPDYFGSGQSLTRWLKTQETNLSDNGFRALDNALRQLVRKGALVAYSGGS